ncbi:MAG: hypothetical protein AAFW70_11135 [Cyanobacteria bacterium J06635_10]
MLQKVLGVDFLLPKLSKMDFGFCGKLAGCKFSSPKTFQDGFWIHPIDTPFYLRILDFELNEMVMRQFLFGFTA